MPDMEPVLYDANERIATITLNRPEKLNAIDTGLLTAFEGALSRAEESGDVDIVLLRGSGRAFCAGDDLEEFGQEAVEPVIAERFIARLQAITTHIMLGSKPVVCAVQGWAVGGGAAWPLNADFCVASDDAVLFCPEAGYGLFPSGGASILLAERCGPALANEVLWLGRKLTAEDLLAHGIVSRVVPRPALDNAARARARELCALPAVSRKRYKQARICAISARLTAAMAYESRCCMEAALDLEVRVRAMKALRG